MESEKQETEVHIAQVGDFYRTTRPGYFMSDTPWPIGTVVRAAKMGKVAKHPDMQEFYFESGDGTPNQTTNDPIFRGWEYLPDYKPQPGEFGVPKIAEKRKPQVGDVYRVEISKNCGQKDIDNLGLMVGDEITAARKSSTSVDFQFKLRGNDVCYVGDNEAAWIDPEWRGFTFVGTFSKPSVSEKKIDGAGAAGVSYNTAVDNMPARRWKNPFVRHPDCNLSHREPVMCTGCEALISMEYEVRPLKLPTKRERFEPGRNGLGGGFVGSWNKRAVK